MYITCCVSHQHAASASQTQTHFQFSSSQTMLVNSILVPLLLCSSAMAKAAPQYNNNPTNVVAVADFPQGGKKLLGTMKFFSTNGTVKVHWDVTKLPQKRTPFYYHIHEKPVGFFGKCSSSGKRFNPNNGPEKCDSVENDSLCAVGDLSGKHGWIATTCFETSYYDPYLSLDPKDPAYVVGKSIVVHYPNSKRMACADIVLSKETPEDADKESKKNVLHNKDLVEANIDGWKPSNEEESKMIEDSHKEWLKFNSEGVTGSRSEMSQEDAFSEFEALFRDNFDDVEPRRKLSKAKKAKNFRKGKKSIKSNSTTSQGYEGVVPEHRIHDMDPWSDIGNGAGFVSVTASWVLGLLAVITGAMV